MLGYEVDKAVLVADAVLQPLGVFQICDLFLILEVIVFKERVQLGRSEVFLCLIILLVFLRAQEIIVFILLLL